MLIKNVKNMNKLFKSNLEEKLAIALIVIVYIGLMLGAYIVLDYIIQGNYRELAMGKEKALEYLNNISVGVMITVITLVIIVNIFMVLLVIGGVMDRKERQSSKISKGE